MSATILGGVPPLAIRLPARAERFASTTHSRHYHQTCADRRSSGTLERARIGPSQRRGAVLCRTVGIDAPVANTVQPNNDDREDTPKVSSQKPPELSAFRKMRIERQKAIRREQMMYMVTAVAATSLMGFLAVFATYYRFIFLMGGVSNFPWWEFGATLLLVLCGMAAMEMYARFAHKVLWHDFKPGWALHKSHHEPRLGPFEANDLYAVANAIPAISLCAYGFFHTGLLGGICFGCGMGITLFGIMYMFVHDGLVHKRFPVGPIANVPYLKRVAAAHKLHHSDKYDGHPWGMFLGLQELKKYPKAMKEVDALVAAGNREEKKKLRAKLKKLKLSKGPFPGGSTAPGSSPLPMPA